MKRHLLLFLMSLCLTFCWATDYRTQEYRQMQQRLCTGWNTWYNNSLVTHVCLPESFAINLCLATDDNRTYLKDVFKAADISNRPERVFPGLRADDGSYTSLRLQYRDIEINVESATDGEDELILVTPVKPSKHHLVVEAGLLYGKEGMIGQTKTQIKAQCQGREFVVNATAEPLPTSYLSSTSPRLAYSLMQPVGVYTGRQRSISEIKEVIAKARAKQEQRVAQYVELAESFLPMQTILAWNTIFDEPNHRAITPVSRNWNQNWGGYVLFDWDTYFASYMFSLFNKDLAFANSIEITKAITPDGFIPNFQSESSYVINGNTSSWDRSQPPVGSEIIWRIYQRYPEKWFLEEVYDELLTWNRWWIANRQIGGYLAWGSHFVRDGKDITEGLQGAMYESGLDNSPMYDDVPMNPTSFTMELADVGLNSMYIMDCKALAEIAGVLGKKQDVKELTARAKQFTKQLAKLWDEETGIFLNKRTDTGELSHRISPTNLYPMLAGACTQKQAERMMKDHYFNPEIFHGEYVLPTIARNDPAYGDNDYWRGRIWGPINFLVYLGMQRYDVKEARQDLINRSKALLMKNWQANGGIFENYNSRTGQGDDVHNADGFYHWGALLTFMEFLENGK